MSFSDQHEIYLLDHTFKNTSYPQPTNLFIALCKSTIADDDTGSTLPSEVSGGAYARKTLNTWTAAASGSLTNSIAAQFAQATASWGTVTDFAVVDHLTTGKVVGYAKLTTSKTIGSGDQAKFATNSIKVSLA